MTTKKLKKPTKKPRPGQFLDYHEVIAYIEQKYGVDTRNYAKHMYTGKPDDPPYQDFWHWVMDRNEVHNGCDIIIDPSQVERDYAECKTLKDHADFKNSYPLFVQEILKMIGDEFGNEEHLFWVEW